MRPRINRVVSMVCVAGLLTGVMTGCGAEQEVPEVQTMICAESGEEAQRSAEGVALRYFYLINNGLWDEAVSLVTPDINFLSGAVLSQLYSRVKNHTFTPSLRAYEVRETGGGVVKISYLSKAEGEDYTDVSYKEGEKPIYVDNPQIYTDTITLGTDAPIPDKDRDGIITQKDMELQDADLLTKAEKEASRSVKTTSTSTKLADLLVNEGKESTANSTETVQESPVNSTGTEQESETGQESPVNSTETGQENPINSTGAEQESHVNSTGAEQESREENENAGASVEEASTGRERKEQSESAGGVRFGGTEVLKVYKKHELNIETVRNKEDGLYYIKLPSGMITDKKLTIQLPKGMKLYVGGTEVSEEYLNLQDQYVISGIPAVGVLPIEIGTNIEGKTPITLVLTRRMNYIYSWLTPTRETKQESMQFIANSLQTLYNSLNTGVEFKNSLFKTECCTTNELKTVDLSVTFDSKVLKKTATEIAVTTTVASIKIPITDSKTTSRVKLSIEDLKIIEGNVLQVPVEVTIRVDRTTNRKREVVKEVKTGLVTVEKENGEWKILNVAETLF